MEGATCVFFLTESGYTNLLYPGYTPDQMYQEPDAEDQDVVRKNKGYDKVEEKR